METFMAATVTMLRHNIIDFPPHLQQWWAPEEYICQLTLLMSPPAHNLTEQTLGILIMIQVIVKEPPKLLLQRPQVLKDIRMEQMVNHHQTIKPVCLKEPHPDQPWKRIGPIAGIPLYKRDSTEPDPDQRVEKKENIEKKRKNTKHKLILPIIKVGNKFLL